MLLESWIRLLFANTTVIGATREGPLGSADIIEIRTGDGPDAP